VIELLGMAGDHLGLLPLLFFSTQSRCAMSMTGCPTPLKKQSDRNQLTSEEHSSEQGDE
jgi:hypothetical protein